MRSRPRALVALCVCAAATLLMLLTGCGRSGDTAAAGGGDPRADLLGRWVVDLDGTLDAARQDPSIPASDVERMPDLIKRMMARLAIEITPDTIVYHAGSRADRMPYMVRTSEGRRVVAEISFENQVTTCTFDLLPDDRMRFTSSASDDMDLYVWARAAEGIALQVE